MSFERVGAVKSFRSYLHDFLQALVYSHFKNWMSNRLFHGSRMHLPETPRHSVNILAQLLVLNQSLQCVCSLKSRPFGQTFSPILYHVQCWIVYLLVVAHCKCAMGGFKHKAVPKLFASRKGPQSLGKKVPIAPSSDFLCGQDLLHW